MQCRHAAKIWFGSKLGIRFDIRHVDFTEWLGYAITQLNENDLSYVAAILYNIWFARNQMVFNFHNIGEDMVINNAAISLHEYKKANMDELSTNCTNSKCASKRNKQNQHNYNGNRRQQNMTTTTRWKKPNTGIIKIKCDANLPCEGRWGLGAVCRNSDGELVAAATWVF
ncbi:unnamed protein product [Trifolium pratense]|uniref:Uncharacterized protein n=1 Tax=Trifolium pratense TaxID=57577 RepID=A0ACB0I7X3_TRIPR|nr:unnamed protein product [Trifolium pratense]